MIEEYIFRTTGVSLTGRQMGLLDEYCSLLQEWNDKFNLTAITETGDIFIKHFADSMLGGFAVPQNAVLCDIGSGGGCPAIPLNILRPDIRVTMLDSTNKKAEFLRFVAVKLSLSAEVVCARAEEFGRREYFDIVTARALAQTATLLEYAAPLLKVGGRAVFYKSKSEDTAAAQNAQKILKMKLAGAKEFILPDGSERTIYIFEKTAPTDSKYPRRSGKPRKSPL